MLSNSNLMWIRLLTSPFWSGTGISLKEDASVIRERVIQADRRSRSKLLIASENPFCAAPGSQRASRELKVPQSTVNKILRKRLQLHPYRLQLVQKLHPEDKETRHAFCRNLQVLMENDDDLLAKTIFSDEANFNLSGKVNRYNVRI